MQVRYQLRHSPIVINHIAVLWTTTGILAGGSAGREIGSGAYAAGFSGPLPCRRLREVS